VTNFLKLNLTTFVLFLSFTIQAQDVPWSVNRDSVKYLVSNPALSTYYKTLLIRYNNYDTTLTLNDYRLLYYGFVFDSAYNGYTAVDKNKIYDLADSGKFAQALLVCDSIISLYPVFLSANFVKAVVLTTWNEKKPDDQLVNTYLDNTSMRYRNLVDAILSSGDGKFCTSAFKTIFVSDEYDILRYFGIVENIQSLTPDNCDSFTIQSSKHFDGKEIYFDTSETLMQLDKELKKGK
jgi:hypothetical protein